MSNGRRRAPIAGPAAALLGLAVFGALPARAAEPRFPVLPEWRNTAQQVAQAGVPLSELADNAPDTYTVKTGDTLWDISRMYLKSPWRWPELWGMNLEQIRNPHLIFPGQVLYLVKTGDRAMLRVGQGEPGGVVRLSPRVRSTDLDRDGIPAIPLHLIEPFLNEAVIFDNDQLATAPRVVGTQEGRVLLSRGDLAYVRGDIGGGRNFRVFREPRPLKDPTTGEVLGYEAFYLGTAEFTRKGTSTTGDIVPDTFTISSIRQEIRVGDKLAPVPPRDFTTYVPHAPQSPISGQIVSIYGDSTTAGQNQIVALNKGSRDGVESGHVFALWRDGDYMVDKTDGGSTRIKLPDERHGNLFVFRVFNRMSYALILSVKEPVSPGDRFTQP
ncbi:MAG: LysM peptidoglycan-binding domain-containing protein [Rhizobacter sp.]|nr:LysM peptidoglycan-binding domain-containing protein [Rhizobacter sp.]